MKEFLKGNYKVDAVIEESPADADAASTEEFERKALSRLGGSICFVSKRAFVWQGDKPSPASPSSADGKAATAS